MGKARIATGILLVTLVTGTMGYAIASAVLSYQDLGFGAEIDFAYIAQNYMAIRDRCPPAIGIRTTGASNWTLAI
jgi:type IV secretion system protein VirD4